MSSTIYNLPGRAVVPTTKGEKVAQWLSDHRAQLGLALSVLVVAGGLGIAIQVNRRQLMERGIEKLSSARMMAAQGKSKEAFQTIDELLSAHRTSALAMQAYVVKGEMLFQDNKFGEAAQNYQEGLRQATNPAYRALLQAGLASANVEMQKFPEAIGQYEALIRDFPDHYLIPRWNMELGRLHINQKEWKKAQAHFERFLTLFPKSPWAPEVQSALAAAKSQGGIEPAGAPGADPKK